MKSFSVTLLSCFILTNLLSGQQAAIEHFYNEYSTFKEFQNEESEHLLSQLPQDWERKHLRLLYNPAQNPVDRKDLAELIDKIQNDGFEPIVLVNDEGTRASVYAKQLNSSPPLNLIVLWGKKGFFLLSFEGTFGLDELENLNIEVE